MTDKPPPILLIDDEPDILELLGMTLARMGLNTDTAETVTDAKQLLTSRNYGLCLTDLRLPDGSGIDVVHFIQNTISDLPVAVISAHGNMETAIEALKAGAFDFISKPIDLDQLRDLVENALSLRLTATEPADESNQLWGVSPEIERIKHQIQKVSRSMAQVHIHGESGTGKELVARLIHANAPHAEQPFIAINCSAIPSDLMESEFFGHTKGSFTGASRDKPGLFQAAEGGTLFLDEIADLPLSMQAKLLRAIQERAIRPVGAQQEIHINCRILSATHKNLRKLVRQGAFREDLFYRINVIELMIPPLREHHADIPILVERILRKIADRNATEIPMVHPEAMEQLLHYPFPGNVRELENILERATAMCEREIMPEDLALHAEEAIPEESQGPLPGESLDDYLQRIERQAIEQALEKTGQHKTRAAELLGISFRSLRYKLQKLGIGEGNGDP